MRGGVHDTFREITIHTAKCDLCNKHNTTKIYRCEKCGRQECLTCWEKKGGDGRHQLHNKDNLKYKGERAPDLPPKQEPAATKAEASPSSLGSGRKRNREGTIPDSPVASAGAYAPTTPSESIDQSEGSGTKRRRQDNVKIASTEKEASRKTGPVRKINLRKRSVKQKSFEEMSASDQEYNLDAAVDNLIDAAGSDTESEAQDNSEDRRGLDSIVEAIDIVENSSKPPSTFLPASSAGNHPEEVTANPTPRTPPRLTQPRTPPNAAYTWPGRLVKAPKHSGLPAPALGFAASQQPSSLHPFVLGPRRHPQRLFDREEEGENEQAGHVGHKIVRGAVSNGLPEVSPAQTGKDRLSKDLGRTK